jgi:radical SAM superfamily enzyme YgiQ (UPF0313 family)
LSKGRAVRLLPPERVVGELSALLALGIDHFHTCDSEFNLPADHARAVCGELIRRQLGQRVRWYAYLAVAPFDPDLAHAMRRAGCVGINFTADSASEAMLATYRQPHRRPDLANAVRLCRQNGIAVMLDLLLGGPGETPESLAETVSFVKQIDPDCAGASLGLRLYPGTRATELITSEHPLESCPGIQRRYQGRVDLLQPTFYISAALGDRPARLVRELIDGDKRFFAPLEEPVKASGAPPAGQAAGDHNYNDNSALTKAIQAGARGAYWDILRRLGQ